MIKNGVKKKYVTPLFLLCIVHQVMEKKVRQGDLYDFYGELLNDHQKRIFESYVFEDLSLKEIAEEEGISRQGVSDLLHRCTDTLEEYESKLHLLERFIKIRGKVDEARSHTTEDMRSIRRSLDEILELL